MLTRTDKRVSFNWTIFNPDGTLFPTTFGEEGFSVVWTGTLTPDETFEGLLLRNTDTGEETVLNVDGTFVCIGQVPANQAFADVVKLNDYGYVDAGENCLPETAIPGVFVAGDCRTKAIRQVTTATADGAVAALAACRYLDAL